MRSGTVASLLLTMAALFVVYLLSSGHPFVAGLVAVIPIKIIGTTLITSEVGGRESLAEAVSGMLVGQFAWGFVLLAAWAWLKL